eukprot:XP_011671645.1 PREDICTED: uncharacterized protein LOC105441835 [Strongylocentrotus purpuratus]
MEAQVSSSDESDLQTALPPLQLQLQGESNQHAEASCSTVEPTLISSSSTGIGPYCKAAGITTSQLQQNLEGVQVLGVLKNGLVLELYDYFIVRFKYQLKSLTMWIIMQEDMMQQLTS